LATILAHWASSGGRTDLTWTNRGDRGPWLCYRPAGDGDLERLMFARTQPLQALLNRSRQSIKGGKGLSEKAFWAAVRKRAQERKTTDEGRRAKR
jgi:hypothetical protein